MELMELNDKYTKVIDAMLKFSDDCTDPQEITIATCGFILRQTIELHQKVDELQEKLNKIIDTKKDKENGTNN